MKRYASTERKQISKNARTLLRLREAGQITESFFQEQSAKLLAADYRQAEKESK